MNKEDVWNLFKTTGKLEYFLMYKKMAKGGIDKLGDQES